MECYKKKKLSSFFALDFPPLVFDNEIVSFEKSVKNGQQCTVRQLNK